ncbi:unconventional myosin-IXAb-like [Cyprinus carpio]|uniref:Unconventional myosin-IXAb-like n=1 Tax=Cyprinus carpio TaxID=7962 RepID=A0A9Q9VV92_CYPCA|nr:unconventional myosin-IXAb-like [Cyprinus carpio]
MPCNPRQHKELDDVEAEAVAGCRCYHGDSRQHQWRRDQSEQTAGRTVEGEDLKHDFERLQLAMEMVGFLPATRKQIFSLLSAILLLGNIRYKKKTYRDDSVDIWNPEVLPVVSELLEVRSASTKHLQPSQLLFSPLESHAVITSLLRREVAVTED